MPSPLTPKQRAFLREAGRTGSHSATRAYEAITAHSLAKRGLVEGRYRDSFAVFQTFFLTDAGRVALKEITP